MTDKLYLWRIHLRGHRLWTHAPDAESALQNLTEQTGEPLVEYCLEWEPPANTDGSPLTDAERKQIWEKY